MSALTLSMDISSARNLRLLSSLLQPHAATGRSRASTRPKTHSPATHLPLSTHRSTTTTRSSSSSSSSPSHPPSSVSPTETLHFSRLASTWWDPHGPSRLLHLMNPLRHTFISDCLSSSSPSSSHSSTPKRPTAPRRKLNYLDIGCGGGIFAESAARLPSTQSVTGLDPTASVLAIARAHQRTDPALSPPKLTYLDGAIEDLPPTTVGQTDIVTLFEVLEHVTVPAAFLGNCIRHLGPGGWIIGSTIARSPLSFVTTKLIAEAPGVGVVPRGTHDWNQYINPDELAAWFERRGRKGGERWAAMRTQGVVYLPGVGWRMVDGVEGWGNYFFGLQRLA